MRSVWLSERLNLGIFFGQTCSLLVRSTSGGAAYAIVGQGGMWGSGGRADAL